MSHARKNFRLLSVIMMHLTLKSPLVSAFRSAVEQDTNNRKKIVKIRKAKSNYNSRGRAILSLR